jgi:SpoVK/Ycf46/Vps4 family AAA+-type ATPase
MAQKVGIVGESGKNLRSALKVIECVSNVRIFVIAPCNQMAPLSPELRRRFKMGTFFFDLPTAEERKAIWALCLKKFSLTGDLPDDSGWTDAEIAQCCELAW